MPSMIYCCNPCREVFTSEQAYQRHRDHSTKHLQMQYEREQRTPSKIAPEQSISCGLCKTPFEQDKPITLARHLNDHHQDFKGRHACYECEVYFVHQRDLDAHHRWAAQGSCGMKFDHKRPCRGHHPPGGSKGRRLDRVNFCTELRKWEKSQLESFKSSVGALVKARKDAEDKVRKQKELEEKNKKREAEQGDALQKIWMLALVSHYQQRGYSRDQIAAAIRARLVGKQAA